MAALSNYQPKRSMTELIETPLHLLSAEERLERRIAASILNVVLLDEVRLRKSETASPDLFIVD
jgi:hypothetical protein